jgi:hypothetical protein
MSPLTLAPIAALIVSCIVCASCVENVANRCPGTTAPTCMAGTICEEDANRGCQVCRCQTPYIVPETQPPQGAPQPLPQ